MASVTRSTRRAEGLHPHHANGHHLTRSAAPPSLFHGVRKDAGNKRSLDGGAVADTEFDAIKPKRARIAVEILAKRSIATTLPTPTATRTAAENVKAVPPPSATTTKPAVATVNPPASAPKPPTPTTTSTDPTATKTDIKTDQNLTKHQAKVINGIKHELDRLQPQATDTKEQGRKLRSQEASRFKSELSAYFPDYDEVIGNEPKEQHALNVDTPIIVVDSDIRHGVTTHTQRATHQPHQAYKTPAPTPTSEYPIRGYGDALFTDVFDAQRIDFSFLEAQNKNKTLEDPLPDKLFQPIHKRAERLERSIRNTEKGRAQHEKDQIIRLLDGLQGHDWLRIIGVSGVTESKKKSFEPARDHFIRGCQAILDKFRNWSLEEKRRKHEKEKAQAEQAEDATSDDDELDGDEEEEEEEEQEETGHDDDSDSASPAKQLHEEAMARSKPSSKSSKRPRPPPPPPPKPKTPEPPKEFKSFFSKRYERDGALNRHRRTGRKVLAWGLPIPDIEQQDFDLPEEYRDEDTLKARERKKRRERRGH